MIERIKDIVTTQDLTDIYHLADLRMCMHCEFTQDLKEWKKSAFRLLLDEIQCKWESVVVIMECPNCFERMWVHDSMMDFDGYPDEWYKATDKYQKGQREKHKVWLKSIEEE